MRNKGKTLLIDADVLCYQIAFRNEDSVDWDDDGDVDKFVTEEKALIELDEFVEEMYDTIPGASELIITLSDKDSNFRVELDETYKANRKDKEKPVLWHTLRERLEAGLDKYRVISQPRLEGDDVLGILATYPKYRGRCVIMTIDKDMMTIPAKLYYFNRPDDGVFPQTPHDAQMFHLTQVLTGDQVDNYPGLKGIGPKKAAKIAAEVQTPREYWDAIVEAYLSKGQTEKDALHQARLAYILQYGDYKKGKVRLWKPERLLTNAPQSNGTEPHR